MCVVLLFHRYVHTWFDATFVFCFCTCVPFKLWVICTVIGALHNSVHELNNC